MDQADGKDALWDPMVEELAWESAVGREGEDVALLGKNTNSGHIVVRKK